jgi:hypothetical protein
MAQIPATSSVPNDPQFNFFSKQEFTENFNFFGKPTS